jgi:hypothetical protein
MTNYSNGLIGFEYVYLTLCNIAHTHNKKKPVCDDVTLIARTLK